MMESLRVRFPCETFKIFPTGTSMKDTVYLFAGAKVVLGPHGGGLGNLIFCRPPSADYPLSVIEVLQPHQVLLYNRISVLLGAK